MFGLERPRSLRQFDHEIETAKLRIEALIGQRAAFVVKHLCENQLSDAQKDKVRATVDALEPLCCERGKVVLAECGLDGVWVEHINKWAYDHLWCPVQRSEQKLDDYKARLENLLVDPAAGNW